MRPKHNKRNRVQTQDNETQPKHNQTQANTHTKHKHKLQNTSKTNQPEEPRTRQRNTPFPVPSSQSSQSSQFPVTSSSLVVPSSQLSAPRFQFPVPSSPPECRFWRGPGEHPRYCRQKSRSQKGSFGLGAGGLGPVWRRKKLKVQRLWSWLEVGCSSSAPSNPPWEVLK